MNAHHQLFGLHQPGTSWVHRLPAMVKFIGVTVVIGIGVLPRSVPFSLGLMAVAVLVLLSSGVNRRRAFVVPAVLWVMSALVAMHPLFFGNPWDALITVTNMIAALFMSRVLTRTTPAMDLVAALVTLARPLDWVGIGAERFGLTAMVMLRSVPYLADSFGRVSQAARARGLERNLYAQVTPVVVDAVHYAHRTADAMVARGLGDGA